MKFGIVVFPGSNCDQDCHHVITNVLGHEAVFLWHKDTALQGADCIVLPGGFSYGDYLRSGAMAACSPIMAAVKQHANNGGLLLGICNGFQVLVESGLLPGALMRNDSLKFICKDVHLRVENQQTAFTNQCESGEVLRIPIAHMEGSYFADAKQIKQLEREGNVVFRYCDANGLAANANPNGSCEAIAGIINNNGNVCGMMPHPERCSEDLLGNRDGLKIFTSIIESAI